MTCHHPVLKQASCRAQSQGCAAPSHESGQGLTANFPMVTLCVPRGSPRLIGLLLQAASGVELGMALPFPDLDPLAPLSTSLLVSLLFPEPQESVTTVDCRQSLAAPHRAVWGVLLPSLHRLPPLWRQHGCCLADAGRTAVSLEVLCQCFTQSRLSCSRSSPSSWRRCSQVHWAGGGCRDAAVTGAAHGGVTSY